MSHVFLALACLALLGIIAAQDYLVPRLRNKPISTGLYGNPYYWWLDAAFVLLAAALVIVMSGRGAMGVVGWIAAVSLVLVAVTDTFHAFVDRLTGGKHELWHLTFTGMTFAAALVLECLGDHGWLWGATAVNVALPAGLYFGTKRMDFVEKSAVLVLCLWLIAWAL